MIRLLQYVYGFVKVRLGDIVRVRRGVRVVRKDLQGSGSIPVYQNSITPLGYYDKSNVNGEKPFVIGAGAAGKVGYSTVDFWAADDCYVFEDSSFLSYRYLYFLLTKEQEYLESKVRKAGIPRLERSFVENLIISLPSIEEQEKVVEILDNFDKIINDLKDGLPAEIEVRRKQYEYYRNEILSFKRLS